MEIANCIKNILNLNLFTIMTQKNQIEWEIIFFVLACFSLIHELSGIKNKRFSFIVRYFLVAALFWNLELFSNKFLNFFVCEMISIGFVIFLASYFIVGVSMVFIPKYGRKFWKLIYFIVYVIITIIIYFVSLELNSAGILPLL